MTNKPWEEELHGRKGKVARGPKTPRSVSRSNLQRIIKRTPEVMVKISRSKEVSKDGKITFPSPRNKAALQGLAEYIGKVHDESASDVELIDEQGLTYTGINQVKEAIQGWGMPEHSTRREALHIVLGMPSRTADNSVTDVAAVERAAAATAAKLFKNHLYLLAHHRDSDGGHPHSHIVVKMEPMDGGKRLDPRKAHLTKYREEYASQLRANGVEANATTRVARLSTRRSLSQASYQGLKANAPERLSDRLQGEESQLHAAQRREYQKLSEALISTGEAEKVNFGVALDNRFAGGVVQKLAATHEHRDQEKDQQEEQQHGPTL